MADANTKLLNKKAPNASIIGTNNISSVADSIKSLAKNERKELLGKQKTEKPLLDKRTYNPAIDILEIQSGCDFACSFCATKFAKGTNFSYSPESIIKEINCMHAQGVREFWITGQDVAAYNKNGFLLPNLIERITSEIRGKYFLRIGMQHPTSTKKILNDLIDAYKNKNVFKFLHLPVQSGSDGVLEKMNRQHSADDFRKIVAKFRHTFPEITVWTDVIAGFPGETEDDFEKTLALLKEVKPDFTNISSYSVRKNTKAAGLRQEKTETKKERTKKLTELCNELALKANKLWIGKKCDVLIDEYNNQKKNWIGRNYAYKPVVLLGEHDYNELVNVRITDASYTYLKGEIEK
jgi:MiaB-like tRNA modifying enzyme